MVNEKFRRQLREEVGLWREEGLINASQYDQFVNRYVLNQLTQDPDHRFIGILLGLGGILLGLGAITFVAANWQVWSRVARTVILLVLLISVNGAGFYLWRQPYRRARFQRLGHGLLLTGGLTLGANLGLMSQMFHQSGPVYQLFLIWGVGVLAIAYGLRLVSLGILSWILVMLAYWNFTLNGPFEVYEWAFFPQIMLYFPLLISLFYLPLAYGLRSRWLYGLWGLSLVVSLWRSLGFSLLGSAELIALASILPAALLWAHPMPEGRRRINSPARQDLFRPIGRSLALWSIGFPLFFFSFRFAWQYNPFTQDIEFPQNSLLPAGIIVAVSFVATLYGWWQALRHPLPTNQQWMTSRVMLGLLGVLYGVAAMYSAGILTSDGPILVNVLLFSFSLVLIHDGLVLSTRGKFWGGMSLLVLGLISRMFEYNTDLTLKAIVLSFCGLGVIAAGLWFEHRVKQTALPEGQS